MKKSSFTLVARAVVGLLLLGVLVFWIGPDSLRTALTSFYPALYALALLLLVGHFAAQSRILHVLLEAKGIAARTSHIFRLTIICQFFGLLLPGGIGPDLVLCYNLVRSTDQKDVALSAVIFIRICVLAVMAALALAATFYPLPYLYRYRLLTGLLVMLFGVYFFLMAHRRALDMVARVFGGMQRYRITGFLYKTYFALAAHGHDRRVLRRIAPYVLLSALIKILTDYAVSQSLGFSIPLSHFFAIVPLVTVISAVPITFAGLGVREGAFIALFALAGVPPEEALTISLVSFSLSVVLSICGALLYPFYGARLISKTKADTLS